MVMVLLLSWVSWEGLAALLLEVDVGDEALAAAADLRIGVALGPRQVVLPALGALPEFEMPGLHAAVRVLARVHGVAVLGRVGHHLVGQFLEKGRHRCCSLSCRQPRRQEYEVPCYFGLVN